jgi:sulfite reductase (ferredoxin)
MMALLLISTHHALRLPSHSHSRGRSRPLEAATKEKTDEIKFDKVERLKYGSNMLREPAAAEFADHERIYVSHDAYQILKYHGSYQQDDRERRKEAKKAGLDKYYQFMLRLKVPGGEVPASLYRLMDDMATEMGQNDLRATTRQAWQMHGILKGNMKTVIARIMKAGSSTVGACGDVSRNVMTSPCPKVTPEYNYVRQYAAFMGELFKPTSQAFSEIWLDGEKLATQEYWKRHLPDGTDMDAIMRKDTDTGIILKDHEEPLYGTTYLPKSSRSP